MPWRSTSSSPRSDTITAPNGRTERLFTVPEAALPYDPHDEASVLAHAQHLVRRTVRDVARELDFKPILESPDGGKGKVGDLVEAWFRIARNQRAEPDLPCGVEVKVAPLRQNVRSYGSKERMVLGLIDFHGLKDEEWESASIRQKIRRILFVAFLHDKDSPDDSSFQHAMLWSPPAKDLPQIMVDWTRTRDTVRHEPPEALTESLGRIMGPCTKGVNRADLVSHPYAPGARTMRRAFAFKGGYVWAQIKRELDPATIVSGVTLLQAEVPQLRLDDDRLWQASRQTRVQLVERAVLARLHRWEGQRIAAVCGRLNVPVKGRDKSLAARLLDAILGIGGDTEVEELAEEGVQVKTVHARRPGSTSSGTPLYPFEAMSFPAIDFDEFLEEDWDEGTETLTADLQRLLVIPTYSDARGTSQGDRVVGRAFLWSPTASQMRTIAADWREIQDIVRRGGAAERPVVDAGGRPKTRKTAKRHMPMVTNDLPGEREGHILHMRPHTADADDKVPVPGGQITRQSFWLNKGFVHRLLSANLQGGAEVEGITRE